MTSSPPATTPSSSPPSSGNNLNRTPPATIISGHPSAQISDQPPSLATWRKNKESASLPSSGEHEQTSKDILASSLFKDPAAVLPKPLPKTAPASNIDDYGLGRKPEARTTFCSD
ncbi:hypothetical protein R6Q59_034787 [Mikania micrantha]